MKNRAYWFGKVPDDAGAGGSLTVIFIVFVSFAPDLSVTVNVTS
jgi:hypothetical protein